MGSRLRSLLVGLGLGATFGLVLAQHSVGRYRRDLFSARSLKRLAALGYLSGHASVDTLTVLRDYLQWEEHPMLVKRAEAIVRRMEEKLGEG